MCSDVQSILSRPAFRARLTARALEDESFRQELLARPRPAIEAELSILMGRQVELPDDFGVHTHVETATEFHFVIPSSAIVADEQDQDLLLFWERILRPAR